MEDGTWTLLHNGEVVAELRPTGGDFPWVRAQVVRRAGFSAVAELFETEVRLLDGPEVDEAAWTSASEAIRSETSLVDPSGTEVPEFLLHIDGDDAWWRWHDKPFED